MSTVDLGMPAVRPQHADRATSHLEGPLTFQHKAHVDLENPTLRKNLRHATHSIRDKRGRVVREQRDWQALRHAGSAIKHQVTDHLPELLLQFEEEFEKRGGHVHWARDAQEAGEIVTRLVQATGQTEVVKIKSMATEEIGLNETLEDAGITAVETDLAASIVQLGHDEPSHIVVPAIHRNREEIREIFLENIPGVDPALTSDPADLAEASRTRLREKFMNAKVAISGSNFAIAETGTLTVVESEGNGRMCLTLPETLISVVGIEKVLPTFADLEVFLQLLPRSSTGERMNPYTSLWTGVSEGDGPSDMHVVLLDNGRSAVLSDPVGRPALHCIRCSACLNVCPVYERAGGHAYGSVYPGPIGAILSPQLTGFGDEHDPNRKLPYASSLCGACNDVCPVEIPFTDILLHLRNKEVESRPHKNALDVAMGTAGAMMSSGPLFNAAAGASAAGRVIPGGHLSRLPFGLHGWTDSRELPAPGGTFQHWWKQHEREAPHPQPDSAAGPHGDANAHGDEGDPA